jgi:hypothetical protein
MNEVWHALHTVRAIRICRWRKDIAAGMASRQTVYAVTSLTSADATAAGLVREHWSIEAHHHLRRDLRRRRRHQPHWQRAR